MKTYYTVMDRFNARMIFGSEKEAEEYANGLVRGYMDGTKYNSDPAPMIIKCEPIGMLYADTSDKHAPMVRYKAF